MDEKTNQEIYEILEIKIRDILDQIFIVNEMKKNRTIYRTLTEDEKEKNRIEDIPKAIKSLSKIIINKIRFGVKYSENIENMLEVEIMPKLSKIFNGQDIELKEEPESKDEASISEEA